MTTAAVAVAVPGNASPPPLVVDLDGTLTPADTLVESVFALLKRKPLAAFGLPAALLRGRAAFKHFVSVHVSPDVEALPLREEVVEYLRRQRAQGRVVALATAAHRSIAQAMAARLDAFDAVISTDATANLKGRAKLAAIQATVGPDFVYAGDSAADIPIWRAASAAVLVAASPSVAGRVRAMVPIEAEFEAPRANLATWLSALRVHQWAKNLLVFVPLLTAGSLAGATSLLQACAAFLAMSLAASASYLANDLWDLDSDRMHPRKRLRPLASGALPSTSALGAVVALGSAAFLTAMSLSATFLAMLAFYLFFTTFYSLKLKQFVLIDVLGLAMLYSLRILVGAVAIGVVVSSWLLAFGIFVFFSLALVKRCSELVSLERVGGLAAHGRDYRVADLTVLWSLGTAASLAAVVVFGLFISAPETQARYAQPELLWFVALGMLYWLSRLWVKAARGEMHDDPLVFALLDRGCRLTVAAMVTTVVIARMHPWWSW